MKKALIVGGSSGIGLALAKDLQQNGYYVYIVANYDPDSGVLNEDNYEFYRSDLQEFDDELFESFARMADINVLIITAGFGRVSEFEYLHQAEIKKLMNVNAVACIRIIRHFYEHIKSDKLFYTGIMGSIAGFISSPAFSVYAASKAAICRFTESVNIELELAGVKNRILNVSPGVIKGTKFAGTKNDLNLTSGLAREILKRIFRSEELYIPDYDEIYKGVIERYNKNPHEFGISSYKYKKDNGRIVNEKRVRIGYLSGTFDLFHVGHLNLLKKAKENCDYLIVGVHDSGAWKGKETFIPLEERKAIVAACKYVDKVVDSCREDSDAWKLWHYNRLFVGSDYKGTERFNNYEEYFEDKGVEIVYFPYTQSTSSTQIRSAITEKSKE